MNLKLSYNWLKEYVKTRESAKEFARLLSLSGPSVEKIIDLSEGLKGVVVGKLIEKKKHPDADRLFVGKVDIGKKTIQLVFGDRAMVDVDQQLSIAVAPTTLPTGQEIKKTKFRGIDSEGMLCLDSELGISQEEKITFFDPAIKPGTPLTSALKILKDEIFDIEITSNRPDTMSVIGIAREASAILNEKFLYRRPAPNLKIRANVKLSISVKEPKLCPRYQAIVMTDVKVEASPLWLQQRLLSAGLRPINNLVDITNYVMLEFGQPMHVFDYEKLKGNEIIVRLAKKGERNLALDGKNYELTTNNLVIADSKVPVAIAGVMGGELSAVKVQTKTVVLESANFDPVLIRKTSRNLNLYSDSSNLFEKGLAPENTEPAILRAIELVMELANGKIASKIFDLSHFKPQTKNITLKPENVSRILGVEIKKEKIKEILTSLGFVVSGTKELKIKMPYWRERDIIGEHDLIEEIARLYGYHNLPVKLMAGGIPLNTQNTNQEFYWEDKVKDVLIGLGFSETYNYSLLSEKLIKNCSLMPDQHLKIANPLSADFEYLRTSLVPGLLQTITENESNFKEIKIFELSKVYQKRNNDLPLEISRLNISFAATSPPEIFYELIGVLEVLMKKLNIRKYELATMENMVSYWQKKRLTAIKIINEAGEGTTIGSLGIIDQEIFYLFGSKKTIGMIEINFNELITSAKINPTYQVLPKFPGVELDLSMEIEQTILYENVIKTIRDIDPIIQDVSFLSVFEGEKIPTGKKALAIRITYRDDNKTLKLSQVQKIHEQVVDKLKKEYNIRVR